MSKRSSIFNTIRTEGAILPAELLQRIVSGDATLEGLKSTDYHLSPSERLNEAATRSWNRLIGVWQTYREILNQLPEEAIGTTETRERWLLPLFQELGYGRLQTQRSIEIEDKTYPISHKASEPIAIHLVSFRYDLDLRPLSLLTTHHLPLTKSSPHSLMQEFLNRSDDHLWGILSNGLKLRILRDNVSLTRSAYVEFDLQAMMDGVAYSDFFLLYLLCHQSRVEVKTDETGRVLPPETCWLEKWYNASIKDGVRALDELRNNVQSAIESLGAGFLSHPANTELRDKLRSGNLSLQDYYHQVLLQVYRLLFVFVAEDRDLLIPGDVPDIVKQTYHKYYSTYRIRELARKKRGTRHSDLWQQLNLLFNGLYDGNTALGLPALGSFLFRVSGLEVSSKVVSGKWKNSGSEADPQLTTHHSLLTDSSTPDLDFCSIANSDLLSAVRFLCYTQKNNIFQPINYRNLGPEELGSVYESLLEMHPEINLEAGYFKLNVVSGSERKTTGSYYTPSSLVNCLLDSALEPVIADAVSGKEVSSKWQNPSSEASPHLPLTTHHSPEQALLALKICDPACGSGHFLISAAHRLAKRLASIRAGEDEPAPSVIQHALRDVIGHCIYGVDINPMSVELCKISLWMEALEPGKPLTFLDHHIQCGNSLLGCTPALLKKGIPDAAFTPLTGDDKDYCSKYKKLNKEERDKDVLDIFSGDEKPWEHLGNHAPYLINLNQMDDTNIENLKRKEEAYAEIMRSSGYLNSKFIYDAWCAAFVWKKAPSDTIPYPITQRLLDNIDSNPYSVNPAIRSEIMRLADEYKFFHWHIAFPDVFPLTTSPSGHLPTSPTSGFDCILGNPPWERVKLQEKEFFSAVDADIANAPNASVRKKMIEDLPQTNPSLYEQFLSEKRKSEGSSVIIREGGFFPLCGRGDLNTYTVFAELNRNLLSDNGNSGCIVPSGIATDDTTKYFFQDIIDSCSLISLYDFANSNGIFPAVDSNMKFSLLTLRSQRRGIESKAYFVFSALSVEDIQNPNKKFSLLPDDIYKINPNTRNCPVFRSSLDAEINKLIYRRVPVLINENDPEHGNPWGIKFSTMFHMSNDSHLFTTQQQLEDRGFILEGNRYVNGSTMFLPLYEAKMMHLFDHRFAHAYESDTGMQIRGASEYISNEDHQNPSLLAMPRIWVIDEDVSKALSTIDDCKKWFVGLRGITGNVANVRTTVCSIIPFSGVGNSIPLLFSSENPKSIVCSAVNFSSLVLDYASRQKVGGINMNMFIIKQLPILTPEHYQRNQFPDLIGHIVCRAIELYYTSWDVQPLASDCSYDGPPFIWDEDRRFEIRCELDALYFHLYLGTLSDWQTQGTPELLSYLPTPRHAVEYIMETFPIVKRKDEKEYGEYRTKLRILEIYDQMTHCLATNTEYRPTLNPPPGPPCDAGGNFIPVEKLDKKQWPKHMHPIESTPTVPCIAKKVVWPPLFPYSGVEKAACAAFLSIMSQKQVASDSELLETLILAVNPTLCNALLDDEDALSLESVKMKAPPDLYNSTSHTVYWKQILKLFEELKAIEIDRNQSNYVIRVGNAFDEIKSRYSITSDVAKYALKAQHRFEEIKNGTQAKQQEVDAVDKVIAFMQRESTAA